MRLAPVSNPVRIESRATVSRHLGEAPRADRRRNARPTVLRGALHAGGAGKSYSCASQHGEPIGGVGYNYTHGTHLDRTVNINTTNPALLVSTDNNAVLAGLVTPGTNPLTVQVPQSGGACVNTSGGGSIDLVAPGILGVGFAAPNCSGAPIGPIGTPAVFNYFR